MPRPVRIELEGAFYHVTHAVSDAAPLWFASRHDLQIFSDLLQVAVRRFGVTVHAYCFLPRSYHVLIETAQANLHAVVRYVHQLYAQHLKQDGRDSAALFSERYRAWVLDPSCYAAPVAQVIHRMAIPVTGEAMWANYRWSSLRAYLGKAPPPDWLVLDLVCRQIAALGMAHDVMDGYWSEPLPKPVSHFYALNRRPPVLGDAAFKAQLQLKRAALSANAMAFDMQHLVSLVAEQCRVSEAQIMQSVRGRENRPRNVAIYMARVVGQVEASTVARFFGLASHSAVCNVVAVLTQQLQDDVHLTQRITRLREALAAPRATLADVSDLF